MALGRKVIAWLGEKLEGRLSMEGKKARKMDDWLGGGWSAGARLEKTRENKGGWVRQRASVAHAAGQMPFTACAAQKICRVMCV